MRLALVTLWMLIGGAIAGGVYWLFLTTPESTVWTLIASASLALIAIVAVVIAVFSSVVIVPETEQAVVVRVGEPVRVINRFTPRTDFGATGAGLSLRIPFLERLVRIDKRMLTVDMERQQVLSAEQLRLEVDAFARFRIIDPVKMVRTAGSTDRVKEQLQPIFSSVLRQELGKRAAAERGVGR